jgi:hypothetical protein
LIIIVIVHFDTAKHPPGRGGVPDHNVVEGTTLNQCNDRMTRFVEGRPPNAAGARRRHA